MKSIKKKSTLKKRAAVTCLVGALLLCGATAFAYTQNIGPFKQAAVPSSTDKPQVNYNAATDEQVDDGQKTAEQNKPQATNSDESKAAGGQQTVNVEISSGPSVSNGKLLIRTLIQDLSTRGSCTLTLSKAGETSIVKSAQVQLSASTSTCKGFDIPVSNLESGTWNIVIKYNGDHSSGQATAKVII